MPLDGLTSHFIDLSERSSIRRNPIKIGVKRQEVEMSQSVVIQSSAAVSVDALVIHAPAQSCVSLKKKVCKNVKT